jgi:cardiolipin synthase
VKRLGLRSLFRRQRRAPGERDMTVAGNAVTLLADGAEAFPSMLAAISGARLEVLLEMYWFDSDVVGRRFADALAERARAGLRVCIIYDGVGSLGADEAMFDALRAAGAEVLEYNPVAPWTSRWRIGTLNNRDHRKILVTDNRVGFTGGINLGLPWAPESEGGGGWRDDAVRIEGPAAAQLRTVFLDTWKRVGGAPCAPLAAASSLEVASPEVSEASSGPALRPVRALPSGDRKKRALIRNAYLAHIRAAQRYVFIANSYFIPDREVRRALAAAAARGVDVRVLVAGQSDVRAVYFASRFLYERLLRSGVAVYEWTRSVFHSKTAVVDGEWSTIGSYNLDYRSWRLNLEINVAIDGVEVAEAMHARFVADASHSNRVELAQFRFRSLHERLLEWFYYLFRRLL